MDIEINPEISLMDEIKIKAQILIPVLQAARAELGEERANCLVLGALRAWSRARFVQRGACLEGSPKEKWVSITSKASSSYRPGDLERENLRIEPEVREFNITRCRYAEFFRQLGEPDLGAVLLCEGDLQLVEEVGSPEVELKRTQTIMEGASYCDFRIRFKSS